MRPEKRELKLTPRVVFEDKTLLVIDKPAGLVVNRLENRKETCLQDWLENYLRLKDGGIGDRAGIVHRLDKETSGLIVVAKTEAAFKALQKQFKQREVEKQYLALVHGRVVPKKGTIAVAISRSPFDRKKFGVFLGGKESKTDYQTKKEYQGYTLLELRPKTGRTHQLRVHLKHINYPIVADEKYGGRKRARDDRKWCPRQFLHAAFLSFTHPATGRKVDFYSTLPADLEKCLAKMS